MMLVVTLKGSRRFIIQRYALL